MMMVMMMVMMYTEGGGLISSQQDIRSQWEQIDGDSRVAETWFATSLKGGGFRSEN